MRCWHVWFFQIETKRRMVHAEILSSSSSSSSAALILLLSPFLLSLSLTAYLCWLIGWGAEAGCKLPLIQFAGLQYLALVSVLGLILRYSSFARMWLKDAFIIGFRKEDNSISNFQGSSALIQASAATSSKVPLWSKTTVFKIGCYQVLGANKLRELRDLFLSSALTTSRLIWLQSGRPSAAWLWAIDPRLHQSQRHTVILSLRHKPLISAQAPVARPHMVLIKRPTQ